MADYWLSPWPGTEAALLLAMAHVHAARRHVGPRVRPPLGELGGVPARRSGRTCRSRFERLRGTRSRRSTPSTRPSSPSSESGVPAARIEEVARRGRPRGPRALHPRLAQRRRRQPARLGSRARARAAGGAGGGGGHARRHRAHAWNKAVPAPPMMPPPGKVWSELLMPREYPLAFFEMSFLLPHFLREGRGKLAMYFTRVYNPVWTNPDGMSWIEMLTDEAKVERHACLTPTWSETAWFADYVLPMGARLRAPRPDEPGDARRALDRLPPAGAAGGARAGRASASTRPGRRTRRPGSGRCGRRTSSGSSSRGASIPTARLGIRKYFESPYRPGEKLRIEEFYRWIFEHSVPGLPAAAEREGLTPLAYMRKYGAFLVQDNVYRTHEAAAAERRARRWTRRPGSWPRTAQSSASRWTGVRGRASRRRRASSSSTRGRSRTGSGPSTRCPTYARSHVHWSGDRPGRGEMVLLPDLPAADADPLRARATPSGSTRSPTTTRCGSIPRTRRALGVETGDLLKVHDRDRPLRGPGLGHRGDPARRARVLASPGALAARRGRRAASAGPPRS